MAITIYKKTVLIGGGAGALDAIDGASLLDGDIAWVYVDLGGANVKYDYLLDDDDAGEENSPDKIQPDSNAGTKMWILQTDFSP